MNIPKILTPKAMTAYISADDTVRQGLEVMRRHGYTAVPVLGEHGEYIGCITEGDFLWHLLASGTCSLKNQERYPHTRPREAGFLPAARHNRRRRRGDRRAPAAELRPDSRRPRLLLRHRHAQERHRRPRRRRGCAGREGRVRPPSRTGGGLIYVNLSPPGTPGGLFTFRRALLRARTRRQSARGRQCARSPLCRPRRPPGRRSTLSRRRSARRA